MVISSCFLFYVSYKKEITCIELSEIWNALIQFYLFNEFLTNFHCFFQSDWVRLSVACKKQLKYPSCSSYCLYYNVTVWRAINCFTIRIYSFIRNVLSWFPCYRVIPYNKGHLLSLVSMSAITWQILSWVTMHWTVCAKIKDYNY